MRRARGLDPRRGTERLAREITETLAEYLERRIGRPRGVLTPDEAHSAIAEATQDAELGARCATTRQRLRSGELFGLRYQHGSASWLTRHVACSSEIGRKGRA